jgi:anion transporter
MVFFTKGGDYMDPATITLIVLALAAFFFISGLLPLAVTSMAACTILGFLGVLTPKEVYSSIANNTVVLFGGMFVIGASLFKTGVAQAVGTSIIKKAGTSERKLILAIMVVTAILSSVCSNTATCVTLMPVVLGIAEAGKLAPARLLVPVTYAAHAGGSITLAGTPPNALVLGALTAAGLSGFGFFEYAYAAIPITIVAIIYMVTIGRKLLPSVTGTGMIDAKTQAAIDEMNKENAATNKDKSKMYISSLIMIAVVILLFAGFKGISMSMAAVAGALLCVITGCISEKDAYKSVDWATLFMFAGMLGVAKAMQKTGAGKIMANFFVGILGSNPSPYLICAVIFIATSFLTQFMSNTATAAVVAPIGVSIAQAIGCDPHALLMTVAMAAASSFATPMACPPNMLFMGPGHIKFNDYLRCGVPLCILSCITCLIVIPLVWPFFP